MSMSSNCSFWGGGGDGKYTCIETCVCFILSYFFYLCIQDRKITGIKDELDVIGTSRGLLPT